MAAATARYQGNASASSAASFVTSEHLLTVRTFLITSSTGYVDFTRTVQVLYTSICRLNRKKLLVFNCTNQQNYVVTFYDSENGGLFWSHDVT